MRVVLSRTLRHLRSVRMRLMVWNICALALILTLLGAIVQYSVRRNLFLTVDHDLVEKARLPDQWPPFFDEAQQPFAFDSLVPPPDWEKLPPTMPPSLRTPTALREFARKSYWPRFLNLKGHSLFPVPGQGPWNEAGMRAAAQGRAEYTTILVGNQAVRVYSKPVILNDKVLAVFQVPYPLQEVDRVLADLNHTLLMLVPVALLLAGLGGAALTNHALKPVRHLAQTTEHIGEHDLSRRLAVVGDDEFAYLAITFNAMLHRLEIAFEQRGALVNQLENLVEQERRFTADASHELKTPLTVIRANASLMLQATPTLEDYHDAMQDVDQAADAMGQLVQDLLLLARYDADQLGRGKSEVGLEEALQKARARLPIAQTAPILMDIAEPGLAIWGNADEIVRLFSNLIENAARFTPPTGEIWIRLAREGQYIRADVADTGIGIAPEHLPHLGERFYRVDSARTRTQGGTGLGLAICKSIAAAYGAHLSITSELQQGTTVSVVFPAGV